MLMLQCMIMRVFCNFLHNQNRKRDAQLCYTRHMNQRDRIIYTVSLVLLGAEAAVMLISILAKPVSDTYLKVLGFLMLATLIPAIYGFVRRLGGRKDS